MQRKGEGEEEENTSHVKVCQQSNIAHREWKVGEAAGWGSECMHEKT